MTKEQQEAKGLIDKFRSAGLSLWEAKRCAIIAVEIMIKEMSEMIGGDNPAIQKYWKQVIEEITFQ